MSEVKGDWSTHDNKRYIGKIDRIYVSMSEDYEVEYFIDHYLETHGYVISHKNRDIITAALEDYPGRAPFKRDDLNAYLENLYPKK
jgi:hypothetical protein